MNKTQNSQTLIRLMATIHLAGSLQRLVNNNNKDQLPMSSLSSQIIVPVMNMFCIVLNSLVFHEYKVEDAVKNGVYQVCQSEVENEKVGNSSHPLVS